MMKKVVRCIWAKVNQAPPDPILDITATYRKDPSPRKANLAIGVYRDDSNSPWVLPSVQKAKSVITTTDHEYLPIDGSPEFKKGSLDLFYPEMQAYREGRVAGVQTLGGLGGLRMTLDLIKRFYPDATSIYFPEAAWPTYRLLTKAAGLEYSTYSYVDMKTLSLDEENLLADIEDAPRKSVFLFQVCGHNPTGIDPTPAQWQKIQDVMARRQHLAIFDNLYGGLASGDIDQDLFPVRLFMQHENPMIHVYAFSKNMGLYGERIGCLSVLCDDPQETQRVLSQLKMLGRAAYSNPSLSGSRIAAKILNNPELRKMWQDDVLTMHKSLVANRKALEAAIKNTGSRLDWSFLTKHQGFFTFTGLNPRQVDHLLKKHHIYMQADGRLAVTGLNSKNIEFVAEALETVTRFA